MKKYFRTRLTSAARFDTIKIGCYLAHTLSLYASVYDLRYLLVLGRVASGVGGDLLIEGALLMPRLVPVDRGGVGKARLLFALLFLLLGIVSYGFCHCVLLSFA